MSKLMQSVKALAVRGQVARYQLEDRLEDGQGLTEYALIIGLVAIAVVAILVTLGTNVKGLFQHVSNCLGSPGNATC